MCLSDAFSVTIVRSKDCMRVESLDEVVTNVNGGTRCVACSLMRWLDSVVKCLVKRRCDTVVNVSGKLSE